MMVFMVSLRMRECVRMPEVRMKFAFLLAEPGARSPDNPYPIRTFLHILPFLNLPWIPSILIIFMALKNFRRFWRSLGCLEQYLGRVQWRVPTLCQVGSTDRWQLFFQTSTPPLHYSVTSSLLYKSREWGNFPALCNLLPFDVLEPRKARTHYLPNKKYPDRNPTIANFSSKRKFFPLYFLSRYEKKFVFLLRLDLYFWFLNL